MPWLALLVTHLLACSDSTDLSGHFILQSADGFQPIAGSSVHLIFEADKLSVSAGCNSLSGHYRVEGGRLIVSGLGSTNRACAAVLLAQDQQLNQFLSAGPRLMQRGDDLALSADSGMILRFVDREVADPDRPLVDTVWVIDTVIDEHSFGSSPVGANALVQFVRDGTVLIQSTCNSGAGRFTVDGDRLTLTNVAYSQQACSEPAAASAEQRIKAALQSGTLTFEIEARRLTLMRESIGLAAQAQGLPAALVQDAAAQPGGP